MSALKEYLGDSVYADFTGYSVVLTTENGYGPTNRIYVEPEVLAALNSYSERMWKQTQPSPKGIQ